MKKEILFYAPIGKGTPPERIGGAEAGCLKTMAIYREAGITPIHINRPVSRGGFMKYILGMLFAPVKLAFLCLSYPKSAVHIVGFYHRTIGQEKMMVAIAKILGHKVIYEPRNGSMVVSYNEGNENYKSKMESLKNHVDDKIFIHIARLHPVKNHKLLFKTFERLIREGEHIQLVVIGSGYETSSFAEYNNHKGIHILGEKRNVGDYLAASDYFVMSSKMEGLPISLLEAMSMGVVPVSTPAGGVCDVIRNHENGYISSSHSYKDYYETIKDAIANVGGVTSEYIITEYKEKYSMIACAKAYTEEFKK